ncbi:predicted protein [Naegleria gruberi]|uniref:Predicted protein n=1 Tax=Naegleria gruberi TaxID=5762 RepID=D2V9Z6_NAEGR|nr:uncharacterized protein NAEGRDRAFT_47843 [Naegleria gruberi]EFC46338.1 predicted protein [Naegleria gruberi]|eukprot:XP_002679082.1 predicted protein [Naegleria gruberi strain NEG-M]
MAQDKKRKADELPVDEEVVVVEQQENNESKKKKVFREKERPAVKENVKTDSGLVEMDEQQKKQLSNIVCEFFDSNKSVFYRTLTLVSFISRLEHTPTFWNFIRTQFSHDEYRKKKPQFTTICEDQIKQVAPKFSKFFRDEETIRKLFPEEFDYNVFFVKRRAVMTYPLYNYGGIYQTHMALSNGSDFLSGEQEVKQTTQTEMEKLIEKQLFDRAYHLVNGYDTKLRGFVMGVENVKILEEGSVIQFDTNPSVSAVTIAATFILFSPTYGTILRGTITNVNYNTRRVFCKVLNMFNASVFIPNEKLLHELVAGQTIQFTTTWCGAKQGELSIDGEMKQTDGIVQEQKTQEEPKTVEEEFQFDETELPFN